MQKLSPIKNNESENNIKNIELDKLEEFEIKETSRDKLSNYSSNESKYESKINSNNGKDINNQRKSK